MNRDEQRQILGFIERAVQGSAGTVLPPMDLEADAIIRARFVRHPEAAYRMTTLAMALERELEAARAAAARVEQPALPVWLAWILARRRPVVAVRETRLPGLELTPRA